MHNGQGRAFSLLEVLVSLALFCLILGITTLLLRSYSRLTRQGEERLAVVQAAVAALEDVGQELRESVAIDQLGPELRFEKLQPDSAGRLPTEFPVPPPPLTPAWLPHEPAHRVEVRYRIEPDGDLYRRLGNDQQRVVAHPVAFSSQQDADGMLVLSLQMRVESRIEDLRLAICRPIL